MAIKNTARLMSTNPLLSTWARQMMNKMWDVTDKYPWLSTRQVSNLISMTEDIDDEEEKKATRNELYRAALPIAQNYDRLDERDEILNQKAYEVSQMQDWEQKNAQITALKLWDLAQKIKRTYSDQISANADDNEVLNQFLAQIPNSQTLLENYLNNWDKELLYAGWLATKNVENPEMQETQQWWIKSLVNNPNVEDVLWDKESAAWNILDMMNIIWEWAEDIDNVVNKYLPTITWEKSVQNLADKINNLTDEEIAEYRKQYDKLVSEWKLKWYTTQVTWDNAVEQIWNSIFGKKSWKKYTDVEKWFTSWLIDQEANFGQYLIGADDTLKWVSSPNVAKFFSNIPWSAIKTLTATIRWMTNPYDTLSWLIKLIGTEEWHQALLQRYGSWEAFANSINTDPVWVADDISSVANLVGWATQKLWKLTWSTKITNAWNWVNANVWSATDAIAWKAVWGVYSAIDSNLINSSNKLANNVGKYLEYTSNSAKLTQDVKNGIKNKAWQWSENILQNQNRMTKKQQETFKQMAWEDQWKWMNDRWLTNAEDLVDYFFKSKDKVDTAMSKMKWNFTSEILTKVLDECVEYAEKTESPELSKLKDLQTKNAKWWITMSDINEVKRFYERNNKFDYLKNWTAEQTRLATNRDTALRDWQMKLAEENWLTNLKELNKETQASKFLADNATKRESGIKGNNPISLTDWIVVAQEWITNKTLGNLVGKKVFQSAWFQRWLNRLLNAISWHETIPEKVADLELIQQINNQKDFDAILKAIESQENMKALWYNPNANDMWGGTIDTRPITTTPEWQSVRQWQIAEVNNTAKNVGNTNNNMANSKKTVDNDIIKEQRSIVKSSIKNAEWDKIAFIKKEIEATPILIEALKKLPNTEDTINKLNIQLDILNDELNKLNKPNKINKDIPTTKEYQEQYGIVKEMIKNAEWDKVEFIKKEINATPILIDQLKKLPNTSDIISKMNIQLDILKDELNKLIKNK